jgi:hypothetical protein
MALELPQAHGGGVDLVVGETGVRQRGTQAIGRHGADPARGVGIDQARHPGEHHAGFHPLQRFVVEPGQPRAEGEVVVDQLGPDLAVGTSLEDEVARVAVHLPGQEIHDVGVRQALLHA